jgi:hypothetical protein
MVSVLTFFISCGQHLRIRSGLDALVRYLIGDDQKWAYWKMYTVLSMTKREEYSFVEV